MTTDHIEEVIEEMTPEEEILPQDLKEYYERLRLLVDTMEEDALKTYKGNKSASIRLRKSLRHLKKFTGEYVKFTLKK